MDSIFVLIVFPVMQLWEKQPKEERYNTANNL